MDQTHTDPEELSLFEVDVATNNGEESYHAKLKTIIKTHRPRIWNFMEILNNVIDDTNNEIGRLQQGSDISRPRKRKKHIKENLRTGILTPWDYLNKMSKTVGTSVTTGTGLEILSNTEESESSDENSGNTSGV